MLIGLIVFALLWLVDTPFRQAYQANDNDVTALVDGLLLLPDARWQDWFTQGHSRFFDSYPEWPWGLTPFARPAFQFLIYLAHFALGRDWPAYLAINYLAIGGVAAVVFAIGRAALGLGLGTAILAAALTIASPAVLEFSIWEVGFASESVVCVLVGCAFLAVLARRDALCFALLLLALFVKETAVWAPVAAGLTVLLRAGPEATPRRRWLRAGAMVLPLAIWFGYRLAFFGGTGGSYATGGYADATVVLGLVASKLIHLYRLFVSQQVFVAEGPWAAVDRVVMFGTYLLVAVQLVLWTVAAVRAAVQSPSRAADRRAWPAVNAFLLLSLWAAMGLAFYFALALSEPRYAASAVMFFWPAAVATVARTPISASRVGLAACFLLMLARTSLLVTGLNPPSQNSYIGRFFHAIGAMDGALRDVPVGIRAVYVISASGLVTATPRYLQAFLGISPEIVRIADLHWSCAPSTPPAEIDHRLVEGVVILEVATPPKCASLFFDMAGPASAKLVDGRIRRSDAISYDLPEAIRIEHKGPVSPALEPGRRMTVHIRTDGPARFIVQDASSGDVTWFDVP